jgi:hypothetical protein
MTINKANRLQLAIPLNGFVPEVADEPVFPFAFVIANPLITSLATHKR